MTTSIGPMDTLPLDPSTIQSKRLRTFTRLLGRTAAYVPESYLFYIDTIPGYSRYSVRYTLWKQTKPTTVEFVLNTVERSKHPYVVTVREVLCKLPICVNNSQIALMRKNDPNAEEYSTLHPVFQELANAIVQDITDAAAAFDDPDVYYPGVNDGIDPVPDTLITQVITGMQRELDVELRDKNGGARNQPYSLPALPLATLPWRIQRAIVERRRLRFAQYGITPESWKTGTFSLWDIPDDGSN